MGAKRSAEMLKAIKLRNAGATLAKAARQAGVTPQGLGFAMRKQRKEAVAQAAAAAASGLAGVQS